MSVVGLALGAAAWPGAAQDAAYHFGLNGGFPRPAEKGATSLARSLPAAAVKAADKAARSIYDGRIERIAPASYGAAGELQGVIRVRRGDGNSRAFLVSKYTLILIIDPAGQAYAGELRQLEPGWKCRVGYDIPADDGWDTDSARTAEEGLKYADNVVAYYKR